MNKKLSYTELQNRISEIQGELALKSEEVNKLKYSFLANVSHEIRTPMNVIVGFSNLLNDPNYNQDQKSFFIDEINKNSRLLLRLIDNILNAAKVESDNIKLNMNFCSINEILKDVYDHFTNDNYYNPNESIALNLIESQSAEKFFTDSEKLKRILINLIETNIYGSTKKTIEFGYTIKDHKSIEFFVKSIDPGLNGQDFINKKDNYNHIQDDDLFSENGLGSGLAVSDKLVRLLGGKLIIKSSIGKGPLLILPYLYWLKGLFE
ncbi:MAG: HAMP domain-containing sensor histidine kinase [Bacteroidales bacterium]